MHNCRLLKAQILRKECCCNKLAKTMKELGYQKIEIVWNSTDFVAIAVEILEQ